MLSQSTHSWLKLCMWTLLVMVLVRMGAWYNRNLSASPYLTNCITGFFIAMAGDVLCQRYFESRKLTIVTPIIDSGNSNHLSPVSQPTFNVDKLRAIEMGVIRALLITPVTQYWYTVLQWAFPGTTVIQIVCRVMLDQAIGSPVVISLVFLAKSILHAEPSTVVDKVQGNLYNTWYCGLQYWPVMHFINFKFVPILYQPLYASIASLYWNAVLSYFANKKPREVSVSNTQSVKRELLMSAPVDRV